MNYTDPTGHIALAVIALIAGAIIGGAIGAYKSYKDTGSVSAGSVVKGALIGGGVGFLAGAGAAILATGAAMATTAEVVAGVKTIVAAGSLSASIGMMSENVKTFGENVANAFGSLFKRSVNTGEIKVYTSTDGKGNVQYVGITNCIKRRAGEHFATKKIFIEEIKNLSLSDFDARAVEQFLIEYYKLGKYGGTLINRINSIATNNPIYESSIKRAAEILKYIRFKF